jgi:hypothetical protein
MLISEISAVWLFHPVAKRDPASKFFHNPSLGRREITNPLLFEKGSMSRRYERERYRGIYHGSRYISFVKYFGFGLSHAPEWKGNVLNHRETLRYAQGVALFHPDDNRDPASKFSTLVSL